jgi:PTH1 family peptidyl-tRNA hydrolase
MHIIIGLGNPGEKYKNTRHNAGFMAIDALAKKLNLIWSMNKKFQAEICQSGDLFLAKPQTFMNESGRSVQAILSYYKLLPKKFGLLKEKNSNLSEILTIIHDDLDIPLGQYKISVDSRSAGHNGVQSIINHLKTKNFRRIRIGIRAESAEKIPADLPRRNEMAAGKFVLQKFSEEEVKAINSAIEKIIQEN